MKKMLSLSALGMAALGTTLWAQQAEEPPPAQAPAATALNTDERNQAGGLADAAASAGTAPSLSPLNPIETQPAQPSTPRASSPGNRSTGSGRSVGGPARQPRPDLDMLPNSVPTPYTNFAPYGAVPINPLNTGISNYQVPRYPNNGQLMYTPDGKHFAYIGPDGKQRGISEEEMQSAQDFRQTVEALRKAKSDDEKAAIRTKLNDLVSKQIDQDLAEREKRLTELEAKAKQLRDQLQQRKQSKADIQKMLVMLIENPQGGLGLPPAWMDAINPSGSTAYPHTYTVPSFTQPIQPPIGSYPLFDSAQ